MAGHGCATFEGYLVGRRMSADQFEAQLLAGDLPRLESPHSASFF